MKKLISAFLLCAVFLFGDSLEVEGNLESVIVLPKGDSPSDVTLFQGKFGGGIGSGNACGLQASFNFFYGIKNSLEGLMEFINDWKSSATALALYGLATYLPIAKEVLLGANTLSNYLAKLRGFSCSQAMQAIKELNYTDSFLIKKCIARKLGIDESNVDKLKETSPSQWYSAYKECLSSASLVDLLGSEGAKKFVKFISPRSYIKCALGVKDNPTADDIANADLYTKAKYFLYLLTPDVTISGNGLIKIETVKVKDPDGSVRPATLVDMFNIYRENFEKDYEELVKTIESELSGNTDLETAIANVEKALEEFGIKYGLDFRKLKYLFGVVGELYVQYKELFESGQLSVQESTKHLEALSLLEQELKQYLLAEAIHRLRVAVEDVALKASEAVKTAKATGSQSNPCEVTE